MIQSLVTILFAALAALPLQAQGAFDGYAFMRSQIAAHPGQTGSYVLDKGEDALHARAWIADHATTSIDVQYFIWSTDNIGILALESLLRAAERGVRVRVLVDDLLMDAPDQTLLALAAHPNFDIRIYNSMHSVGVPLHTRLFNVATDFRGANQRMHDKTFIADGHVAITGGRNMADEYFDFDQKYNFRDRDALVLGEAVHTMHENFERFWTSDLSTPVERLLDGVGIMQKSVRVSEALVQSTYRELHKYATSGENYEPQIRAAINALPESFVALAAKLTWGRVDFISDQPGKNSGESGLGGGGLSTRALADLLDSARSEVIIQSPYLVLSDDALKLFVRVRARGVRIRINTNSLASTDNIQAFSGYRNQRARLLALGLEIYEFRPDSQIQENIMQRYSVAGRDKPIFALHAKTMVIDGAVAFIGTYNLDPRSENLNTEVGVVIYDRRQAEAVATAILTDMLPANSWNAAQDEPDQFASFAKRAKVAFWQTMPIKPLL